MDWRLHGLDQSEGGIYAYIRAVDGRIMTREHTHCLMWGPDFNQTLDQKAEEQRLATSDLLHVAAPGATSAARNPRKSSHEHPRDPSCAMDDHTRKAD